MKTSEIKKYPKLNTFALLGIITGSVIGALFFDNTALGFALGLGLGGLAGGILDLRSAANENE